MGLLNCLYLPREADTEINTLIEGTFKKSANFDSRTISEIAENVDDEKDNLSDINCLFRWVVAIHRAIVNYVTGSKVKEILDSTRVSNLGFVNGQVGKFLEAGNKDEAIFEALQGKGFSRADIQLLVTTNKVCKLLRGNFFDPSVYQEWSRVEADMKKIVLEGLGEIDRNLKSQPGKEFIEGAKSILSSTGSLTTTWSSGGRSLEKAESEILAERVMTEASRVAAERR